MAPATAKPAPNLRVPVVVCVGIIGRWDPNQEQQVASAIEAVREELEEVLDCSPARFTLASGVDPEQQRLWAKTGSKPRSAARTLTSWLPAEARRYFRSFKTVRARTHFLKLLHAVKENSPNPPGANRDAAEQAIRNCDVLIAIWTPPEGLIPPGAAQLMSFALEKVGRTLYWIDPSTGKVKRYDNYDGFIDWARHLNLYNAAHGQSGGIADGVNTEIVRLEKLGSKSGLAPATLNPLYERVLPHFLRAEHLASRWQRLYLGAGFLMYLLAAVAVATGTYATMSHASMAFVEVAEMSLILLIICFSELLEMLRRWLDYRFLAERLRAAIYLYVAGLSGKVAAAGSGQWMGRALHWLCDIPAPPLAGDLQAVKNLSLKGWIEHQAKYYFDRSRELEKRQTFCLLLGIVLFLVAAIGAFFHGVGHIGRQEWWEGMAIVAPACGASVAGFRSFREFRRTSLQYGGMVRKLSQIADRLKQATTPEEVKNLLMQADDTIVQEHQGWRILVHVHEPIEEL
ncbi:MAG TPA: SLATT domain-containing protein [Bryobacteraceae bacterium]|nr:SLATT domain-containing protein [Bryobacteraceae bacterium]